MADQSIAKSFRGILRIANITETVEQSKEMFLNPDYFGTPKGGVSDENKGYNTAYPALSGALERYAYPDDPYKTNKVPITDSLGNYLNINVSADSVTFGSDELNNGSSLATVSFTQQLNNVQFSHPETFPILTSKTVIIGLENRVLAEEKDHIIGGTINVEESPYNELLEPMVIVNNNYDHTPSHISNGDTYIPLTQADPNRKYRTIYRIRNNKLGDYDTLVHFQDDIDVNNYQKYKTIDAFVDVIDLRAYVKEKVDQYVKYNFTEMPPGMVIPQYINLKKWYGIGETGNWEWMGQEPPMGTVQNTPIYAPTLYQGVVRKGLHQLVIRPKETDPDTEETHIDELAIKEIKEVIPIYKRDYTMCNGDIFKIYVMMPELSYQKDYHSYERFVNLFFAIGYQYTDFNNIRVHYENKIDHQDDGNVYKLKGYEPRKEKAQRIIGLIDSAACKDRDVLFEVDFVAMQAARILYDELKNGTSNNGKSAIVDDNGNYSRSKAEAWLKNQPFPREFIFNSYGLDSDTDKNANAPGFKVPYKQPNYKKPGSGDIPQYEFPIGREINSFSSLMKYYDHSSHSYVVCKAWQTAEVQQALDLYTWENVFREKDMLNYFTYSFQVPNFDQHVEGRYDTGVFLGGGTFNWTQDNEFTTDIPSISHYTANVYPHRHVICMGPSTYKFRPAKKIVESTGDAIDTGYIRAMGISNLAYDKYVSITWAEGYKALTANNPTRFVDSYNFAEMKGLRYELQSYQDVATNVIQWGDYTYEKHPDPRWRNAEPNRGLSSEPVNVTGTNEKYESATPSGSGQAHVEWFNPESIQMVYLIKL